MTQQAVTILGSTGTIGVNTLDVIARHPAQYRVYALTANSATEKLLQQCQEYLPEYAVMLDAEAAAELQTRLHAAGLSEIQVLSGIAGLQQVASAPATDVVMAAIVGAAGLLPTLAAAEAGKRILLANKEALVMSGALLMDAVRHHNAILLPIDSEHNAIWQCLPTAYQPGVQTELTELGISRILLTASGGPFREMPLEQLATVTPTQACAHPNWRMGQKISVDSATMMNKGLELIEACWLFNTTPAKIDIVIHPQSIIHSLVAYCDGSVLAQLGNPDMRTPIAHALAWPQRIASGVEPLDLFAVGQLDFQRPDAQRFPCLDLAIQAMQQGGTATTILNAANEIAVAAFLAQQIQFTEIARVVEQTLTESSVTPASDLAVILQADAQARAQAQQYIMDHL